MDMEDMEDVVDKDDLVVDPRDRAPASGLPSGVKPPPIHGAVPDFNTDKRPSQTSGGLQRKARLTATDKRDAVLGASAVRTFPVLLACMCLRAKLTHVMEPRFALCTPPVRPTPEGRKSSLSSLPAQPNIPRPAPPKIGSLMA